MCRNEGGPCRRAARPTRTSAVCRHASCVRSSARSTESSWGRASPRKEDARSSKLPSSARVSLVHSPPSLSSDVFPSSVSTRSTARWGGGGGGATATCATHQPAGSKGCRCEARRRPTLSCIASACRSPGESLTALSRCARSLGKSSGSGVFCAVHASQPHPPLLSASAGGTQSHLVLQHLDGELEQADLAVRALERSELARQGERRAARVVLRRRCHGP